MWQWMRKLLARADAAHVDEDDAAPPTAVAEEAAQVREPDPDFEPVTGWIRVDRGGLDAVRAAVFEYGQLYTPVRPATFRIELHPQPDGAIAVVPRDGLPAFDIANLTVWLSAPPGQMDVEGARVRLTSPGDGLDYALAPDPDNPAGDTLAGVRSDGRAVRVYVPETLISEADTPLDAPPPIDYIAMDAPAVLELVLDTDTSFGNPRFVVDGPAEEGRG